MKRGILLITMALCVLTVNAQTETTDVDTVPAKKTIRIGNILIIKNNSGKTSFLNVSDTAKKKSRITTNWGIIDFGFSNFSDKTQYGNVGSFIQNNPNGTPVSSHDFRTNNGKSINVNIWFFMQKINLIKENVSLKYGLGLELNNYRFKAPVSFREDGPLPFNTNVVVSHPYVFRDTINFTKNKLAADYLTIPVMVSFSTNEKKGNTFGLSAGVSVGYLYSSRNKQVSEARGKEKNRGDFDMESFKFSYIAELTLGPVRLYGSYSPKSMFANDMDFRPYTFGLRLSKF